MTGADETVLTVGSFPLLGCADFTAPAHAPPPRAADPVSRSPFLAGVAISSAPPRFRNLTANIRRRRGHKVAINVPIFRDERTMRPFVEDFSALGDDGEAARAAKPDHIYMDCMGFGMGCCCLQVSSPGNSCRVAQN